MEKGSRDMANIKAVDGINLFKDSKQEEIKPIAIDLGSSSIKACGAINGRPIYKKIKSKCTEMSTDDNFVVEMDNRKVHFGVGKPLIKQDKTQREYIAEQILLCVHQIYGASNGVTRIKLAVAIPLNLYEVDGKREKFQESLEKLKNQQLTGLVNGDIMVVEIESILVCAEGYSAYYALADIIRATKPFIIFDFGYRTTDALVVTPNLEEGSCAITSYGTVELGMYEVFKDIQRQFLNDTGKNLPLEDVETCILYAPEVKVANKDNTGYERKDIRNWIHYGSSTFKDIYRDFELMFGEIGSKDIYLVGGGATLISQICEYITKSLEEQLVVETELIASQEDLTFANSAGCFMQII